MPIDYLNIFSPDELEYLNAAADDYGWYVWTDETRSIIEGLCARRLMAANGDFKVIRKANDRRAHLAGEVPRTAASITRYYELIGEGRIAFHALRNRQVGKPTALAPSLQALSEARKAVKPEILRLRSSLANVEALRA
ncbi:hypothetical protein [Labrys monachus]|uniref:Uncharacterized protein n=1 Tax=Labrys monachus TaxID=217067 RepID=A0ABU0FFA4_9HYPH|nr:hypothetical protein [Labrys monachus]MDQ0392793.1 hypothetical protein [Labrys monachus]